MRKSHSLSETDMFIEEANPILVAMIDHPWIFPAAECVHIASFALAVGTIAAVDLSLLGIGLPRKTAPQVVRDTDLWTLSGLILIFFSGMLLFGSDPDHYYLNLAFQIKITCLVLAIVYNYTIHRKVAMAAEGPSGVGKVVGGVSLLLWAAVVFGGLFIAFA